jgi:hypothetical protein
VNTGPRHDPLESGFVRGTRQRSRNRSDQDKEHRDTTWLRSGNEPSAQSQPVVLPSYPSAPLGSFRIGARWLRSGTGRRSTPRHHPGLPGSHFPSRMASFDVARGCQNGRWVRFVIRPAPSSPEHHAPILLGSFRNPVPRVARTVLRPGGAAARGPGVTPRLAARPGQLGSSPVPGSPMMLGSFRNPAHPEFAGA